MKSIIEVKQLNKKYDNGFVAINNLDLTINKGEIFALLGPNGAGKTTLISIICGITTASAGSITVAGKDIVKDYRETRSMIGLVPQELTLGAFEKVVNAVSYSRGLHGCAADPKYIKKLLNDLSLWPKRNNEIRQLSGGMKRRLLIAKALSHQPRILFLDEPTAGVDVELRKDMWRIVATLQQQGVTIILTTHYIEEAEAIADRVGIIRSGEMLLVEDKKNLMKSMGKQSIQLQLSQALTSIPDFVNQLNGSYDDQSHTLSFHYNDGDQQFINHLFEQIQINRLPVSNVQTRKASLEDIFVNFISKS